MNLHTMKNMLRTKIKFYEKIPREGSQYTYLSVISTNSVYTTVYKKYYPQMFLEECKYVVKKEKIPEYNIVDIILIEKILLILMKKILMNKVILNK